MTPFRLSNCPHRAVLLSLTVVLLACVLAPQTALCEDLDPNDILKNYKDLKKFTKDPAKYTKDYLTKNYKDWILGPEISPEMHEVLMATYNGVDAFEPSGICEMAAYGSAWNAAFKLSHEGMLDGMARSMMSAVETLLGGPSKVKGWIQAYINGKNSKSELKKKIQELFEGEKPEVYTHTWTDSAGCLIAVVATLDSARGRYDVTIGADCRCQILNFRDNDGGKATLAVRSWGIRAKGTVTPNPDGIVGISAESKSVRFSADCDCSDYDSSLQLDDDPSDTAGGAHSGGPSGGQIGVGNEFEIPSADEIDCTNVDCNALMMEIVQMERRLIQQRDAIESVENNTTLSPEAKADILDSLLDSRESNARVQNVLMNVYKRCCQNELPVNAPSAEIFKGAIGRYHGITEQYEPPPIRPSENQPETEPQEELPKGEALCPECEPLATQLSQKVDEHTQVGEEKAAVRDRIAENRARADALPGEIGALEDWLESNGEYSMEGVDADGNTVRRGPSAATRAKQQELDALQEELDGLSDARDELYEQYDDLRAKETKLKSEIDRLRQALEGCNQEDCPDGVPGDQRTGFMPSGGTETDEEVASADGNDQTHLIGAIRSFRSEPQPSNGLNVQPPFVFDNPDGAAQIRDEVAGRQRDIERSRESRRNRVGDDPRPRTEVSVATDPVPTEPDPSSTPTEPGAEPTEPSTVVPTRPTFTAPPIPRGSPFIETTGRWIVLNPRAGVPTVSLEMTDEILTLRGMGPNIPLRVNGNTATGRGATLFNTPGHDVNLTMEGPRIRVEATHPDGGSWTTFLSRSQTLN